METLVRVSEAIDRFTVRIGKLAAWAGLVLIGLTIFDVVTRRFLVLGSTKLQEGEWHAHVVLFTCCLAYAYMKDSHVRIDLVRERLKPRTQMWLELIGCLVFLLPYCALVIYYSISFAAISWGQGESSASATGLSHRWIIKSFLPIGFGLLALAGIAVVCRKIVELFGPEPLARRLRREEEAEAAPFEDYAKFAVAEAENDAAVRGPDAPPRR